MFRKSLIRESYIAITNKVLRMSLPTMKQEILETMLLYEKPMKAKEIADESKKEFRPVMMHLLGLVRMDYVCLPEKGHYIITEKGKQALGLPATDKEKATAILCYSPHEKAFHFYLGMDKPLNLHAHNLRDFANKIQRVELSSIQFHMKRGDFEAWLISLGDKELAKKVVLLNRKDMAGEELRKQLYEIVEQRYIALAKMAGQPIQ